MGFVTSVCTYPEYTGQGIMKHLMIKGMTQMHEEGKSLSLIHIFGAMNQAFFTLSLGICAMSIFGSYIGKERSLLGESVRVVVLDTFVAKMCIRDRL